MLFYVDVVYLFCCFLLLLFFCFFFWGGGGGFKNAIPEEHFSHMAVCANSYPSYFDRNK